MTRVPPDRQVVSHFHAFVKISALVSALTGAMVFAGWVLGIDILGSRRGQIAPMRPSEALALALGGLGLALLAFPKRNRWIVGAGTLAAAVVALSGVVNLGDTLFAWNVGLDHRLLAHGGLSRPIGNRLDPLTSTSLLLLGAALIALRVPGENAERLAKSLALAITPGALLVLLSYLAGSPGLHTELMTPMAMTTACVFLLLAAGIVAGRVERGWSQAAVLQTPGGRLLRTTLPFVATVPLIAWVRLEGERAGWYSRETGLALFSLLGIAGVVALTYWASQIIDRAEFERQDAERHYRAVFDNDIHAILIADDSGRYVDANLAACRMYGRSRNQIVGRRISEFVASGFDFEKAWHDFLSAEYATGEWPVTAPDGRKRVYQYYARANFLPGLHLSAFHDITERKQAELVLARTRDDLEARVRERTAQLSKTNEQLREAEAAVLGLSRHLLRLRDEEWRRISRELHDSTGQNLSAAMMNLSLVQGLDQGMGENARNALTESMGLIDQSLCEIRMISYLLHPPLLDERGLRSALAWFAEGFERRSGIRVILNLPEDMGRLPADIETGIFRIIQECFSNIGKYSGSSTASIKLERHRDGVLMEVRDEGTGIPAEKLEWIGRGTGAGVGLLGMRERARLLGGSLEIESTEKGTLVRVILPVAAALSQAAASSSS